MRNLFRIGDIVIPSDSANGLSTLEYFIVGGVDDDLMEIRLIKIYPIKEEEKVSITKKNISDVVGIARSESAEWKIVIDMVNRKREEKKMSNILDEKKVFDILLDLKKEENEKPKSVTHNMTLDGHTDVVSYANFEKIDECLDAINALREAEKLLSEPIFGDKIDILFKRLKELSEKDGQ